jgi:histidyl-tRNA synthetase
VSEEHAQRLRKVASLRGGTEVVEEAKKLAGAECSPPLEHLHGVTDLLDVTGVKHEIDFGIARGLDYYTGFVFEAYVGGIQVAGGGRYDELIELLGGAPTPATGVGFGVDRISRMLLDQKVKILAEKPQVMIIPTTRKLLKHCFKIAAEVREAGISAEVELAGRRLTKALAHADSINAGVVVLVGPRELKSGEVLLRDMKSGEQEAVRVEDLAKKLKTVS